MLSAIAVLSALACDAAIESGETSACSDCVVLDTVAILGFENEDFFPSPMGDLAGDRAADTWAFVDRRIDTRVTLFRPDGVVTVGGEGDGPGEYRGINDVWLDSSSRLVVLDRRSTRIRRYDEDLELASEQVVDFRIREPSTVSGGRTVAVALRGTDGAEVGYLTPNGTLDPLELPTFEGDPTLILTASDSDSTVWVAEPNSFRIWSVTEGAPPQVMTGTAPEWFRESFRPDVVTRMNEIGADTDGATALMLSYDPETDILWAVFGVPSSDFTVAELDRMLAGESELVSDFTDHVVVALSVADGSILGTGRFDYLELRPGDDYLYELDGRDELFVQYPRLAGTS